MNPAKRSEPISKIPDPTEREEQIRRRAYELYEARGQEEGHELDDWLQAEAEILGTGRRATAACRVKPLSDGGVAMTPKTQPLLHAYSVKIETPTGKSATLSNTLLTPKQVEQIQLEFKRLAHEAGIKGARIAVQRVVADDYERVMHEAKACLRTAMAKAA